MTLEDENTVRTLLILRLGPNQKEEETKKKDVFNSIFEGNKMTQHCVQHFINFELWSLKHSTHYAL